MTYSTQMQIQNRLQQPFSQAPEKVATFAAAVKSLMELIRMKHQALSRMNQSPQLTEVQQLLTKVGEDSCKWVRTFYNTC